MGRYFLKRLWHGAIVIFGVTVLVFVVPGWWVTLSR